MKEIIRKFKDCKTQLCQFFFIFLALFLPKISNIESVINTKPKDISFDIIDIIYYFLSKLRNLGIGIFFAGIAIFTIRKMNKNKILNNGNIYHDHSYLWFLLCSKILGYEKCNLVLVPIYMQFKLVINDVFSEFIVTNNISEEKTSSKIIYINCDNKDSLEPQCYLILFLAFGALRAGNHRDRRPLATLNAGYGYSVDPGRSGQ